MRAFLLSLILGTPALAQPVFLHEIALIDESQGATDVRQGKLRLVVEADPGKVGLNVLARRLKKKPTAEGTVTVEGVEYPGGDDKPTAQHAQPSFLIDYDEPSVKTMRAEVERELGKKPTMDALAQWVHRALAEGMSRQYDLASVVAKRREGDCTEHAVLLTALARSFGFVARVTHGLVVGQMQSGETPKAFGHAWVEYRNGSKWRVADAALLSLMPLVYLPTQVVTDESAGFMYGVLQTGGNIVEIRRVRVLPPN